MYKKTFQKLLSVVLVFAFMFSITTNVLANPEDSGLPSKKPNIQNTTSDNLKTNQLINKEVPFSARSSYYQNTFSNYEYERNGNICKLRNKNLIGGG